MCAGGRVTRMGLASRPVGACFHLSVVPPIRAGQYSPSIQFLSTSGVHRECRATLTLHVMAGSPQQGLSDRARGFEFAVANTPYAVLSGGRDMSQPGPLQHLALCWEDGGAQCLLQGTRRRGDAKHSGDLLGFRMERFVDARQLNCARRFTSDRRDFHDCRPQRGPGCSRV